NRSPEGAIIAFDYSAWPQKSEALGPFVGSSGTLTVFLLSINGSDEQDHLIPCAVTDTGAIIPDEAVRRFFDLPSRVGNKQAVNLPQKLKTETARRKKVILDDIAVKQADWFEEEIEKLNFWADDKRKGLKAELKDFDDEIAFLKKEARLAANLPDKLTIQKKLRGLAKKRDAAWKQYDEAAKVIEQQKDLLLDTVEERLRQTVEEKTLFTIRWKIV
ncbi:MAG TPA: hypothetical protein VI728_09165, partial [Syntrophales bacterium]|nr:hypothetical protein [Syntrophales bacterium]